MKLSSIIFVTKENDYKTNIVMHIPLKEIKNILLNAKINAELTECNIFETYSG